MNNAIGQGWSPQTFVSPFDNGQTNYSANLGDSQHWQSSVLQHDPLIVNPLDLLTQPHVHGGNSPWPMVEPRQSLVPEPVSSSWPVPEDVYGVRLPCLEALVPTPIPSSPSVNLTMEVGAHVRPSNSRKCSCLACLNIGVTKNFRWGSRVPGCSCPWDGNWIAHERAHYGDEGHYRCAEEGCRATLKRWHDFTRHYTVHHCKVAERYPCSVSDCKYAGENGFLRRDKLKSHYRNKHQKAKANVPESTPAGPRPGNHGEKRGEPSIGSSIPGAYGAQM